MKLILDNVIPLLPLSNNLLLASSPLFSSVFVVFSVSERVVENGRLVNAINLTAQQPNIIENNKLALWLETSMPSREKKDGYKLLDWDDLSKNKILFMI